MKLFVWKIHFTWLATWLMGYASPKVPQSFCRPSFLRHPCRVHCKRLRKHATKGPLWRLFACRSCQFSSIRYLCITTVDGSEILWDVKNLENHDYTRTYQLVSHIISSISSIITCSLSLQSWKHPTIEAQGARAFVKLFFDVGQADGVHTGTTPPRRCRSLAGNQSLLGIMNSWGRFKYTPKNKTQQKL